MSNFRATHYEWFVDHVIAEMNFRASDLHWARTVKRLVQSLSIEDNFNRDTFVKSVLANTNDDLLNDILNNELEN